jgi:hypothetical protein
MRLNIFRHVIPVGDRKATLTTRGVEKSERGVYRAVDDGWWRLASEEQDRAAQESQGEITDRTREFLGTSDRGIMLLRKLLLDSIDAVESGKDPFGLLRDPSLNTIVRFDAQKNFADTDKDSSGNPVHPARELVR